MLAVPAPEAPAVFKWVQYIGFAVLFFYTLKALHDFTEWFDDRVAAHFANQKAILQSLAILIQGQERQLALIQGKPDPEGEDLKDLEDRFHQHPPEFTVADLLREYGTGDNYRNRLKEKERRRIEESKSATP
jgi:hypothetical protein